MLTDDKIEEMLELAERASPERGNMMINPTTVKQMLRELLALRKCVEQMERMKPWLVEWLKDDSSLDAYLEALAEYERVINHTDERK